MNTRIKSLELKNIGVFENEKIEFRPCPVANKAEIHIFTGTNGSGKSTLLKALVGAFEAVVVNNKKEVISKRDTNNLSKYFRNKSSRGTVSYQLADNIQRIKYSGCPLGIPHLHILSEDHEDIDRYRAASLEGAKHFVSFSYAFFAYSGYRLLNFSPDLNVTVGNKNPLFQSLEFIKKPNPAFSIDNWIKNSLLKRSYAQTEGLTKKEHNYTDTIQKLENAISEVIGFKVRFKLDKHLRDPVIFYNEKEHDLEVLPDGLKSIISWLADLCMRLEGLNWKGDIPIFDRNIILFLDEIEVHLHIEWQRKILPVVQKLLPNAQIFLSTHSPFVVNSVDDAWVYNLEVENGNARVRKVELSQDGNSISYVLRSIFGVTQKFGLAVENDLKKFYAYRNKALALKMTTDDRHNMLTLAKQLAFQSLELQSIISMELRQLNKQTQKNYEI